MVQEAIVLYGVLGFLAVRFVLAAAALAPYGVRRISLQTLTVGAGVGFALALGYLFQTTATRLALLIVSLGLTLTGALVEQHGGQLKVRASAQEAHTPGSGCLFATERAIGLTERRSRLRYSCAGG